SHVMAAVPSPEEVAVRHAITTVLQDYARGVDDRDWDLVRRCYHPDAVDDHGVYRGDVEGFVAHFARQARAWDRTAHYVFEPHIELDGEAATVVARVVAHHVSGTEDLVIGARYRDRFECRDGDWRIARRRVDVDWVTTVPA